MRDQIGDRQIKKQQAKDKVQRKKRQEEERSFEIGRARIEVIEGLRQRGQNVYETEKRALLARKKEKENAEAARKEDMKMKKRGC